MLERCIDHGPRPVEIDAPSEVVAAKADDGHVDP
jgi:hypothetical protein